MSDDGESAELDLSCGACGQSACLTEVSPLRFEHAVDVWARVHTHDVDLMDAYRASAERVHGGDEA